MIPLLFHAPIAAVLTFLGSVAGSGYALVQLMLVGIAARWPTVEGEIVGACLVQRGFDGRGLAERVTYRYSVAGRPFVNDRVRLGPQPQRGSIVPAPGYPIATSVVVRRYPPGQRVLVRYNPRRPEESVLHAQPNVAVVMILAGACVGLYVGGRGVFGHP
jgi:hypothetical protein